MGILTLSHPTISSYLIRLIVADSFFCPFSIFLENVNYSPKPAPLADLPEEQLNAVLDK